MSQLSDAQGELLDAQGELAQGELSNAQGELSNALGHIANGAVKNKDRHHLCQQLVYFAALVGDRLPLPADPFSDPYKDPAFKQVHVVRDLMKQFESRYPQEGKSIHVKGAANTILGGASQHMKLVMTATSNSTTRHRDVWMIIIANSMSDLWRFLSRADQHRGYYGVRNSSFQEHQSTY